MRKQAKRQRGFTLIELVVVIAILGILAAIVTPNLVRLISRGGPKALDADKEQIQLAVDTFKSDKHKGPDSSHEWGKEDKGFYYPTEDGEVGDLELSTSDTDPNNSDNYRIDKYKAGAGTDGAAGDSEIDDSLIWMGLLVNEPSDASGSAQKETGDARPQGDEEGEYLQEFPQSAAEDNTDSDTDHTNGNGYTSGSYVWVLLHNGKVVPAYKGSDGKWYSGYSGTYP